ncbi:MAG: hypothetical protein ACRC68_09085 [Clostridium sp.]
MYCNNCGNNSNNNDAFCPACGNTLTSQSDFTNQASPTNDSNLKSYETQHNQNSSSNSYQSQTNESYSSNSGGTDDFIGKVKTFMKLDPPAKDLPQELQGWNWGAFILTWIWGVTHNSFNTLVVFIPYIGWLYGFMCGYKGSEWLWNSRDWNSVEECQEEIRRWNKYGFIALIVCVFIIPVLFVGCVGSLLF